MGMSSGAFDKINEICEQLTLCTDLFSMISSECPASFNI